MGKIRRVQGFVDGFNLYHAIANRVEANPDDVSLKWLDVRKLCLAYAPHPAFELSDVFYFSAYATWLPGPYRRHQRYTSAIEACGASPVMGFFKEKIRSCRNCGATWTAHEEKESDVALAVKLLSCACRDSFDMALIVTADSDIAPALREVAKLFPSNELRLRFPPGVKWSRNLASVVRGKNCRTIKWETVRQCRLPEVIRDPDGQVLVECPTEYASV